MVTASTNMVAFKESKPPKPGRNSKAQGTHSLGSVNWVGRPRAGSSCGLVCAVLKGSTDYPLRGANYVDAAAFLIEFDDSVRQGE